MATIADMSEEELRRFVEDVVDERLTALLGVFEEPEGRDEGEELTWDEILAFVERHRWTPPPGAKSSLELLREDRDR